MFKIAACRYLSRVTGWEDKEDAHIPAETDIFYVGSEESDPELWGPPLYHATLDQYSALNLAEHLRRYWARELGLLPNQISLEKEIIVGAKLFVFSCSTFGGRGKGLTDFVMLRLPVDKYARQARRKPVLEWKIFFGRAILFFAHKYQGK